MCKPIRNRQEPPGMEQELQSVPESECLRREPCLESSAWFMGAHRLRACELLLVPPSPLTASSKDLSALTGDPCIMFNKAALLLLQVKHKGPGLFLLGCNWFTHSFVIQYWQLPSAAQQNHSAYSPCHRNNTHPERLGEDYNPSAFLQCITSRICKRSVRAINPNMNLTNFRCSGPVIPCSDISQVLHGCLELLLG